MAFSVADTLAGRISLTILAIILTFANSVVIIAYSASKRLRNSANRFVLSLAISDLVVSCILVPLMAWDPLNPAVGPIISFSLWGSLANICGCTFDRFNAIKNPLLYTSIMTQKRFIFMMVFIWTIPFLFSLVPQIWLYDPSVVNMDLEEVAYAMRIYVGFMTISVLLVCAVLFAVYVYIFRVAKHHYDAIKRMEPPSIPVESGGAKEPAGRRKRRETLKNFFVTIKATILFALIGFNFILCWLPLIITNLFLAFDLSHLLSYTFVNVGEILMYANSLLNPIAYAFFQKEFRRTVSRFFRLPNAVIPSDSTYYSNTDRNTHATAEH